METNHLRVPNNPEKGLADDCDPQVFDTYLTNANAKRKRLSTIIAAVENFPILQLANVMCLFTSSVREGIYTTLRHT